MVFLWFSYGLPIKTHQIPFFHVSQAIAWKILAMAEICDQSLAQPGARDKQQGKKTLSPRHGGLINTCHKH